ncbi:MAG: phosphoethanolamine transferase [Paludibacteraceae bacterium]|nr:phosphoethanolamine transferase [Paludibacteraceae bacterium]
MFGILALCPLLALATASDLQGFWGHLVYALTVVSLYGLGLTFLTKKKYFFSAFVLLLIQLCDILHIVLYGATTSLLWVYTGLIAEGGETVELFTAGMPVILLMASVVLTYLVLTHWFVRNRYIASRRVRSWAAIVMSGWLLVASVCCAFSFQTDRLQPFRTVLKVTPINYIYGVIMTVSVREDVHDSQAELVDFKFDAQTTAENDELVVFVLGETSRYCQWQLNGYERETSPRLMARGEELISFDSCYTVANLTTVAVPLIMSRATPHHLRMYFKEPSMVDAFQEAGYRTAWIADQSFNNVFLLNISGKCDYLYYHEHDITKHSYLDEELIPPLRKFLAQNQTESRPQFAVLHSLGCHFKYSNRYPESYRYFTPDLNDVSWETLSQYRDRGGLSVDRGEKGSAIASVMRTILTNSYDNALRYTDMFIDSVITTLEQTGRPVIMLYVGDHGENLLDTRENKMLHGQLSHSVYEFHVPMFIWASDSYKQRYPEKWQTIYDNRHKHVSTMNIYHSLLQMGSVEMPALDTTMSISSPDLQPETVAWILDSNLQVDSIPLSE